MSNVNDTFFDGHYKDIWKAIIPEQLTIKETEFILNYFKLQPGQHVLDLMCGYGRHALSLVRHGINVTAVDNLQEYVEEIRTTAEIEKLPVEAVQADILTYKPAPEKYDLALCMGNSLNFFNPEDTSQVLENLSSSLKSEGYLIVNTWSLAEITYRQFLETEDNKIDGFNISSKSRFYFNPCRIETNTTMRSNEGLVETKLAIDYIYSINEIDSLLKNNGLILDKIFSIPGVKEFTLGDPRAYIICQKY